MCRINGWIDKSKQYSEADGLRMRDAMQHGGPDGAGYYKSPDEEVHFGHRRLSLIDLTEASHQPMLDTSNQIALVFNGEIYNFKELRSELMQLGHVFHTTGDTEIILKAYKEWGTSAFSRFNGMFALAIHDQMKQKVILARDHAGIKPLYYSLNKNGLIFASEVRAFTSLKPDWEEDPNWKKYFLLFGFLPEPHTTLKDVHPLPKGTFLQIDTRTLTYSTHFFHRFYYNYSILNEEEALVRIREELQDAVKRHLFADAPIGLFLSGGIDSSLLTLIAQQQAGEQLRTLSIVFDDEKYSEKKFQDLIIKKTRVHHESFLIGEKEFKNSFSDIIESIDQPSNDGINSYFICKYARAYGLKAVLSGIGADELFGGYPSFQRTGLLGVLKKVPKATYRLLNYMPDDKKQRLSFLQHPQSIIDYLYNRGFFIPEEVARLLDCTEEEIIQLLDVVDLPPFYEKLDAHEQVSYLETNWYMQNQLLKDTDYMSMWHSIEVRVPFLDRRLMDLVYQIAPSVRYSPEQAKHLLIKAFHFELPRAIWDRPKHGFVFPFETWMKQVKPIQPNAGWEMVFKKFQNGQIHWSRYWCYLQTIDQTNLNL